MPNLLGSRFAFPKSWVLRVLMPKNCYATLILSHNPSQNLGADSRPTTYLLNVKQSEGELLGDYVSYFNQEVM